MPGQREKKLSHASLQQAAHWYVLLNDEDASVQARLQWQSWLEQHSDHRDAWHYVERVGQRFAPLQAEDQRDTLSMVLRNGGRASMTRRQSLKSLLLMGAGGLLGWGTWKVTPAARLVSGWSADYATGTGETREATLADGSRLWLNAISAVDADFSHSTRLLRLRFGEVLIDTARDSRPFLIDSEHGRIRALGTRFSVRQTAQETWLNVFEGAVQVRTGDSQQVETIAAGQQLAFTRNRLGDATPAQSARESWIRGVLVAENMPLGQLIDELARFRPGHLACSPAVAPLPVMGTFPLGNTDQALGLLQAALPVRIQRLASWWVSVEALAAAS